MKYDLSAQAHDQVSTNPIPLWDRLLISPSGITAAYAHDYGSRQELSDLRVWSLLLAGSSGLTAIGTTLGLHLGLGADGIQCPLVATGAFIGTLTAAIDHVVLYRGSLSARGLAELRLAGLKLPDAEKTNRVPYLIRAMRIGQAATFGLLTGTFVILATNSTDIRSHIDAVFIKENQAVAEESTKLVDASIYRTKQTLATQDIDIASLNRSIQALRSNDVRRSVGRKANAPSTSPDPQLEPNEVRLAQVTAAREATLASLKGLETGRNAAIEKMIMASLNSVPKRTGFAAQLEALSTVASSNPKLWLFILALDFLSLALELGPMWAAATRIPSALAARLARDHFIQLTELAREGAQRLGVAGASEPEPEPPKPTAPAAQQPARRGRPRKSSLDVTAVATPNGSLHKPQKT